jgi:hypothetical protein
MAAEHLVRIDGHNGVRSKGRNANRDAPIFALGLDDGLQLICCRELHLIANRRKHSHTSLQSILKPIGGTL